MFSAVHGILFLQVNWTHSLQNNPTYTHAVHPDSALAHWLGPSEISHHPVVHIPSGRVGEDYVDLVGLQTDRSSRPTHREPWELPGAGTWPLTETLHLAVTSWLTQAQLQLAALPHAQMTTRARTASVRRAAAKSPPRLDLLHALNIPRAPSPILGAAFRQARKQSMISIIGNHPSTPPPFHPHPAPSASWFCCGRRRR